MELKLSKQLQSLRKQKGLTQEELAEVFNVTNQSVSKWESGQTCPDISLLPEIAEYFKVSIDELLGYKPMSSVNSIYLQMKSIIDEAKTRSEKQELAYILASLASTCQWEHEKQAAEALIKDKKYSNLSVSQSDGGVTVKGNNALFICSFKNYPKFNNNTIRKVSKYLSSINKINTLKILFALFEMSLNKGIRESYTMEEIVAYTGFDENNIWAAFNDLNIKVQYREDGTETWYLACMSEVPMLVTLLIPYIMDWSPEDQKLI